jgi:hypothetical protein
LRNLAKPHYEVFNEVLASSAEQVGIDPGLPYCSTGASKTRVRTDPILRGFCGRGGWLAQGGARPSQIPKSMLFSRRSKTINSNSRQFVVGDELQVIGLNVKD